MSVLFVIEIKFKLFKIVKNLIFSGIIYYKSNVLMNVFRLIVEG